MKILINLLINALAVFITAYVVPGVYVRDFMTAVVVAVILGVVNVFIKPVITILALPLTILTLGLFQFVVNALLIMLVGNLVPGFTVNGFLSALLFSLLISLVSGFLRMLARE